MKRRGPWWLIALAVVGYAVLALVVARLGLSELLIVVTIGGLATPFVMNSLARRRERKIRAAIARRAAQDR